MALVGGVLCVAVAAAHADTISGKRAEAQRVLSQLQRLDANAQRANSLYEAATTKLNAVEQRLALNKQALGVAHVNLARGRQTLAKRLVAIYMSQDEQSSLAVILGAKSLDDLINRIEAANSISSQDSTLIAQVISYQRQIVNHRVTLRKARATEHHLVAVRAEAKNRAEGELAAEQRLYNSVRSQIAQLEAEQAAAQRAAALRAEAAARAQTTATQLGTFGSGGIYDGSIPGERYSSVVSIAMQYLGVPYVWGGESPAGFDCSGLVAYVYAQVGVSLPHYTVSQWDYPNAVSVPESQLEPGDLVFFYGLGHVGIYVGNGHFIDAPHTGSVVSIENLADYAGAYDGAKRILG